MLSPVASVGRRPRRSRSAKSSREQHSESGNSWDGTGTMPGKSGVRLAQYLAGLGLATPRQTKALVAATGEDEYELAIPHDERDELCTPDKDQTEAVPLFAWGRNLRRECGLNDGGFVQRPQQLLRLPPAEFGNPIDLAAGHGFAATVLNNGALIAWGAVPGADSSTLGQAPTRMHLPQSISGTSRARFVACGRDHVVVVSQDGTCAGWGSNSHGQLAQPPSTRVCADLVPLGAFRGVPITNVVCGGASTLLLSVHGRVLGVGDASHGQLGHGSAETAVYRPVSMRLPEAAKVRSMACGVAHSLVLCETGELLGFGGCGPGQQPVACSARTIKLNHNLSAIGAGGSRSFALTEAGMVVIWGEGFSQPVALDEVFRTGVHIRSASLGSDGSLLAVSFASNVYEWRNPALDQRPCVVEHFAENGIRINNAVAGSSFCLVAKLELGEPVNTRIKAPPVDSRAPRQIEKACETKQLPVSAGDSCAVPHAAAASQRRHASESAGRRQPCLTTLHPRNNHRECAASDGVDELAVASANCLRQTSRAWSEEAVGRPTVPQAELKHGASNESGPETHAADMRVLPACCPVRSLVWGSALRAVQAGQARCVFQVQLKDQHGRQFAPSLAQGELSVAISESRECRAFDQIRGIAVQKGAGKFHCSFSADTLTVAGSVFYIHVRFDGTHIHQSPFCATVQAGALDPSRSLASVSLSRPKGGHDASATVTVQGTDRYGNHTDSANARWVVETTRRDGKAEGVSKGHLPLTVPVTAAAQQVLVRLVNGDAVSNSPVPLRSVAAAVSICDDVQLVGIVGGNLPLAICEGGELLKNVPHDWVLCVRQSDADVVKERGPVDGQMLLELPRVAGRQAIHAAIRIGADESQTEWTCLAIEVVDGSSAMFAADRNLAPAALVTEGFRYNLSVRGLKGLSDQDTCLVLTLDCALKNLSRTVAELVPQHVLTHTIAARLVASILSEHLAHTSSRAMHQIDRAVLFKWLCDERGIPCAMMLDVSDHDGVKKSLRCVVGAGAASFMIDLDKPGHLLRQQP